jgi:hypothetical protein
MNSLKMMFFINIREEQCITVRDSFCFLIYVLFPLASKPFFLTIFWFIFSELI